MKIETLEKQGIPMERQAETTLGLLGYKILLDEEINSCEAKDGSHVINFFTDENNFVNFVIGVSKTVTNAETVFEKANELAHHVATTINVSNFKFK